MSQIVCLLLSHTGKPRALAVTSLCPNHGRNATMATPHVQSTIMTNTISSPRVHLTSLIFSSPNPHSRIISSPSGSPLSPYVNVPCARCRSHLTPVRSSSELFLFDESSCSFFFALVLLLLCWSCTRLNLPPLPGHNSNTFYGAGPGLIDRLIRSS